MASLATEIRCGDTLAFTETVDDYKATDGWTLHYALVNPTETIEFSSSADGGNHAFDVAATTTRDWTHGEYRYQAYVDNVSNDRHTIHSGRVCLLPNLVGGAINALSHVEKVLEALEAVLEGKATEDQQSMQINGRALTRFPPGDLLKWRSQYRLELLQEKQAERIKNGLGAGNQIRVRFK